jgi:HAD superfamily hydrolase (TIGR01509 family)
MIDLVIFDCDGVLVDSEVISADVLIAELACIGIGIDRAYVRRHFLGRSFPKVASTIRDAFPVPLPDDFEARYRRVLLKRFEDELRPTPGLEPVLAGLAVAKCVATSSSPPRVSRSLAITGLDRYFGQNVFTASQVERGKPFPDLFLLAAREMGAPPRRVLVVEDSEPGVQAAIAAGMHVVLYCGGSHLAGSRPDPGADVVTFDNWTDFPQVLGRLQARMP